MDKKEWIKHCKWVDTFRGKIITNHEVYKNYGKTHKKENKKTSKQKK